MEVVGIATTVRDVELLASPFEREQRLVCLDEQVTQLSHKQRSACGRDPSADIARRVAALEAVLNRLVCERDEYVRVCCAKKEAERRSLGELADAQREYAELVQLFDECPLGRSYLLALWYLAEKRRCHALVRSSTEEEARRVFLSLRDPPGYDHILLAWRERFELIKAEVDREDGHPDAEAFTESLERGAEEMRHALERFVVEYTERVGRAMPGVDCSLLELEPLLALDKVLWDEIREFACMPCQERKECLAKLSALRCAYAEKLEAYRSVSELKRDLQQLGADDVKHLTDLEQRIEQHRSDVLRLKRLCPLEIAAAETFRTAASSDLARAQASLAEAVTGGAPCDVKTGAWRTYWVYECETFEISFQLCPREGETLDLDVSLKKDNTIAIDKLERERLRLEAKIAAFSEALRCGLRRQEIVQRMSACKTREDLAAIERELEDEPHEDAVLDAIRRCELRVKEIRSWQQVLFAQQERGVCVGKQEASFRFDGLQQAHTGKYLVDAVDRNSGARFLQCFYLTVKPKHTTARCAPPEAAVPSGPFAPRLGMPFHMAIARLSMDMEYACKAVPYYVICGRLRSCTGDDQLRALGEHLCSKWDALAQLVCVKRASSCRSDAEREAVYAETEELLRRVTLQEFKDRVRPELLSMYIWTERELAVIRAVDKDTAQSDNPMAPPPPSSSSLEGLSAELEALEERVAPASSSETPAAQVPTSAKALRMLHSATRAGKMLPPGDIMLVEDDFLLAKIVAEKASEQRDALAQLAVARVSSVASRRAWERSVYACHPHFSFAHLFACRGAALQEFVANRSLINERAVFDRPRSARAKHLEEELARCMRALVSDSALYLQDALGKAAYYGMYFIEHYAPLATELGRFLADAMAVDATLERAVCECVSEDEWDEADALVASMDAHIEALKERAAASSPDYCAPTPRCEPLPDGEGYMPPGAREWFSDSRKEGEALALKCAEWERAYERRDDDDERYPALSDALNDLFCSWSEKALCKRCTFDCAGCRAHHRAVWQLLRAKAYTRGGDPSELLESLLACDRNAVGGVLRNLARWMRFSVDLDAPACAPIEAVDAYEKAACARLSEALCGREEALEAAGDAHCKLVDHLREAAEAFHRDLPVWKSEVPAWRERVRRWFLEPVPGAQPGFRAGGWSTDPWRETALMVDSLRARFPALAERVSTDPIRRDRARLFASRAEQEEIERHFGGFSLALVRAYCSPLSEKYDRVPWFLKTVDEFTALYTAVGRALLAWFDEWAEDLLPLRFCFRECPPKAADKVPERLRSETACLSVVLEPILATALAYRTYSVRRAVMRERIHAQESLIDPESIFAPSKSSLEEYLEPRDDFYRSFSGAELRALVIKVQPMHRWMADLVDKELAKRGSLRDAYEFLKAGRVWNGTGRERTAFRALVSAWRRLCSVEDRGFERLLCARSPEEPMRVIRAFLASSSAEALQRSLQDAVRAIADAETEALEYYVQDAYREMPIDRRVSFLPQPLVDRLERNQALAILRDQLHQGFRHLDPAEVLSVEEVSPDAINPPPFGLPSKDNYVQGVLENFFFLGDASPEPKADLYPGNEYVYVREFYRSCGASFANIDWASDHELAARTLTVFRFLHARDAFDFLYGEEYNLKKLDKVVSAAGDDPTALWRHMFWCIARFASLHVGTREWAADYAQIKDGLVPMATLADAFKDKSMVQPFLDRKEAIRARAHDEVAAFSERDLTLDEFVGTYLPDEWRTSSLRTALLDAAGVLAADGRISVEAAYKIAQRGIPAVDQVASRSSAAKITLDSFKKFLAVVDRELKTSGAEPLSEQSKREFDMLSTQLRTLRSERDDAHRKAAGNGAAFLRTAAAFLRTASHPNDSKIRDLELRRDAMLARHPQLAHQHV